MKKVFTVEWIPDVNKKQQNRKLFQERREIMEDNRVEFIEARKDSFSDKEANKLNC